MNASALLAMSDKKRREFFESKGVDLTNVAEKSSKYRDQWRKNLDKAVFDKHMRFYDSISLWSGNQPLHFTFNDWDSSLQDNSELAKKLGNECFMLAKGLLSDNYNVMLSGNPGVGKTSLALAMLDAMHDKQRTTMFVSTMSLAMLIDKRIDMPDVREKLSHVISAMKRVDVLLLDDFGTEGGMKQDIRPVRKDMQDRMFEVADARLATDKQGKRTKSTIITTNNTPKQLLKMYNEKLISRLLPHKADHAVDFTGLKDVRK